MGTKEIIDRLLDSEEMSVSDARIKVPKKSGLYAIFIDKPDNLRLHLHYKKDPILKNMKSLIYIGQTSGQSLKERLVRQDLRGKGRSIFFNGIGILLKSKPPIKLLKGKNERCRYKFGPRYTREITNWIETHLSVRCIPLAEPQIKKAELDAIRKLKPLMNIKHNQKNILKELTDRRKACKKRAENLQNRTKTI